MTLNVLSVDELYGPRDSIELGGLDGGIKSFGSFAIEVGSYRDASGQTVYGLGEGDEARIVTNLDDGTRVIVDAELPQGFKFSDLDALPIGDEAGQFVFALERASGEAYDGTPAQMMRVSLGEDGVLAVDDIFPAPVTTSNGAPVRGWELEPMADGRMAVRLQKEVIWEGGFRDRDFEYGVLEASDDRFDYTPLLEVPESEAYGIGMIGLDDGGVVVLSRNWDVPYSERGLRIRQMDEDGELVADETLSNVQINGIGVRADQVRPMVELTDGGELRVILLEENPREARYFDEVGPEVHEIVYDLLPAQSDTAGIELPLLRQGKQVEGAQGDDVVRTYGWNNEISTSAGDDLVRSGGGMDRVWLGDGADTAYGGTNDDELYGGDGDDTLIGGSGRDELVGGDGADFLRGNHGTDFLFGGEGDDDLNGGYGDDVIRGGEDDDKVSGYDGNDVLLGEQGEDHVTGGRGVDVLFGGAGDDILRGGEGADTLWGDGGDDRLIGGAGADKFVFDLYKPQYINYYDDYTDVDRREEAENGEDTIQGFVAGEDKIVLDATYLAETDEGTIERVSDLTFDDIFLSQD